jgi:hypothetical protein
MLISPRHQTRSSELPALNGQFCFGIEWRNESHQKRECIDRNIIKPLQHIAKEMHFDASQSAGDFKRAEF